MADQLRVNGNQYGWGSIVCKVAGGRLEGFTGISYADSRERVKAWGMGRHQAPRGRTRGKYTTEPVKLTGFVGSMQTLREDLAKLSDDGVSYGDVEFEIVLMHVEPSASSELPVVVEFGRCVITKNSASHEEGGDPSKEEIEIDCMSIRRNGLTLFDSTQGTPA